MHRKPRHCRRCPGLCDYRLHQTRHDIGPRRLAPSATRLHLGRKGPVVHPAELRERTGRNPAPLKLIQQCLSPLLGCLGSPKVIGLQNLFRLFHRCRSLPTTTLRPLFSNGAPHDAYGLSTSHHVKLLAQECVHAPLVTVTKQDQIAERLGLRSGAAIQRSKPNNAKVLGAKEVADLLPMIVRGCIHSTLAIASVLPISFFGSE